MRILIVGLILLLISCQQSPEQTSDSTDSASNTEVENTSSNGKLPYLLLYDYQNDLYEPRSIVKVNIGVTEIEVGEAVPVQKISTEDYGKYQIPQEAVDACGGTSAGAGDYFYIIKSDAGNYYQVMHASIDNPQENPVYDYKSVLNFVRKDQE